MDAWFVHPGLLLLALAAVIPWWLARRARREPVRVAWGAMRWLNAARLAHSSSPRPRWWTALLRSLLLIAVAGAVAIPQWTPPSLADPFASRKERTWWILVIDDGPTSGYLAENPSIDSDEELLPRASRRIDLALREARSLLERAGAQDVFSLHSLTTDPTARSIGPLADRSELRRSLDDWSVSAWQSDGIGGLERIADSIRDQQDAGERFDRIEVVIWSHAHAATWRESGTGRAAEVLRVSNESATLHFRDWGTVHAGNASITHVEGIGGSRFPGESFPVWVTVANRDSESSLSRRLKWRIDERLQGEVPFQLEPLERRTIRVDLQAPTVGRHALSFALDDDPLPVDSIAWEAIEVIEQLELRVWTDDAAEAQAFRAWGAARRSEGFQIELRVGPPSPGESTRVADSVWILGSIVAPPDTAIGELRRHLEAGGGAMIACGPERSPEFWLRAFGLLPVNGRFPKPTG